MVNLAILEQTFLISTIPRRVEEDINVLLVKLELRFIHRVEYHNKLRFPNSTTG